MTLQKILLIGQRRKTLKSLNCLFLTAVISVIENKHIRSPSNFSWLRGMSWKRQMLLFQDKNKSRVDFVLQELSVVVVEEIHSMTDQVKLIKTLVLKMYIFSTHQPQFRGSILITRHWSTKMMKTGNSIGHKPYKNSNTPFGNRLSRLHQESFGPWIWCIWWKIMI